jgi:hypothetical protein
VNDETKVALERAGFVRDGEWSPNHVFLRPVQAPTVSHDECGIARQDTVWLDGEQSLVNLHVTEAQIPRILAALATPTPTEAPPTTDTLTEAQLAMVREAVESLIWDVDPYPYKEAVEARAKRFIEQLREEV